MRKTTLSFVALPAVILGAAAVPAVAAEQAAKAEASDGERIICRKMEDTGSLVRKTKVCLTRDQWRQSGDNGEKYARELADGLRTKPGGQ